MSKNKNCPATPNAPWPDGASQPGDVAGVLRLEKDGWWRLNNMSNPFANWSQKQVDEFNSRTKLKLSPDATKPAGVERECDLHGDILDACRKRGWLCWHGSMAHRAMRTLGEPDFTILCDGGRVFFIECKSATGKLTTEQRGLAMQADRLGHKIHVVRNLTEFNYITALETKQ